MIHPDLGFEPLGGALQLWRKDAGIVDQDVEPLVFGVELFRELPDRGIILLPGHSLRVYDSAAVDAAADDMQVHVLYRVLRHPGSG